MCELCEVDPDGDLLIILSPPADEAFAPWNDPDDELTVSPWLRSKFARVHDDLG